MAKLKKIGVSMPREMVEDIRAVVRSGEYPSISAALRDALRVWQQKQRARALVRPATRVVRKRRSKA